MVIMESGVHKSKLYQWKLHPSDRNFPRVLQGPNVAVKEMKFSCVVSSCV